MCARDARLRTRVCQRLMLLASLAPQVPSLSAMLLLDVTRDGVADLMNAYPYAGPGSDQRVVRVEGGGNTTDANLRELEVSAHLTAPNTRVMLQPLPDANVDGSVVRSLFEQPVVVTSAASENRELGVLTLEMQACCGYGDRAGLGSDSPHMISSAHWRSSHTAPQTIRRLCAWCMFCCAG